MSKKKSKKKKKKNNISQDRYATLKNNIKTIIPDAGFVVRENIPKLSDAVLSVVKPMLIKCDNYREQEILITTAILTWNICVLPNVDTQVEKEKILNLFSKDKDALTGAEEVLNYIIQRKNLLYKNDKRLITGYDLKNTSKGIQLDVAYPVDADEK